MNVFLPICFFAVFALILFGIIRLSKNSSKLNKNKINSSISVGKEYQNVSKIDNVQIPQNKINIVGHIIRYFSCVILIIGIVFAIIISNEYYTSLALYIIIADIITFMFFLALSEIIILLDRISKNKN